MSKQKRAVPNAGEDSGPRRVQVGDLMTSPVLTTTRHQRVGQVRAEMAKQGVQSLPVVDKDGEAIGMVTSSDFLRDVSDETLIGKIMTSEVYTVPTYSGVYLAARIMRNHKIHHVVVTHEKKVVGLVSSFDLLRLVEDKRFAFKVPPTAPKKSGSRVKKERDEG